MYGPPSAVRLPDVLPHPKEIANDRFSLVKKNILHDILKYNQELAEQKSLKLKESRKRQLQMMSGIMRNDQQKFKNENERKREQVLNRKKSLRQQYERQICQKNERQLRQKQQNSIFAEVERDYMNYRNEQRVFDMERVYRRPSYIAKISQPSSYQSLFQTQQNKNKPIGKQRIKTEPFQPNPQILYDVGKRQQKIANGSIMKEYQYEIKHRNLTQNNKPSEQLKFPSTSQQTQKQLDSLSDIKIKLNYHHKNHKGKHLHQNQLQFRRPAGERKNYYDQGQRSTSLYN